MKKIPVATVNIRFLRIPVFMIMFIFCISMGVCVSSSIPPIKLNPQFMCAIIRSNTVFLKTDKQSIGVYSLIKATPISQIEKTAPKNTDAAQKDTPSDINIVSRSPQASALKISNSTSHSINPSDFCAVPKFLSEDFSVLILHTHTTESYTPSEKFPYTPSDTDRTRDKNFNMVRVGKEIEKTLTQNGIKVYHDTTINDYPSYNGSYNRSSTNASAYIKNDPSIKVVLDVHRDAVEGQNGEKVKYTSSINGEDAASIMFVVGSNLSGLDHDNWESNMCFAAGLWQHTQSLYPTLCRPINFRSQRFNQQLAPGAIIVEVGTNGNTLDEALLGAKYFADALSSYIKTYS